MAKSRKLIVDVIADASKFTSELNKAETHSKRLRGTMQKLGKSMAIGIGAAGAAAFAFGKSALDAAIEAEKANKAVEATIKSTGGAANVTAKQIDAFASSMQMKTGIDDEVIKKSQAILLGFQSVRNEAGKGNDIFNRASVAMLDLGTKLGGTDAAAKALGRALSDPIGGLKGLKGAGVILNDEQKATIKNLVESGDLLGAQKIILDEVSKATGGFAESQATAGDKAKVAFGELQEQVGKELLPVFNKLSDWFLKKGLPAIQRFFKWADKNRPTIAALAGAILAVAAAIGIANAVMWLLSLNPIVMWTLLITGAVVALAAILFVLYQKFEIVRTIVDTVGRVIRTVAEGIWAGIKFYFALAKKEIEILAEVFTWLWNTLQPVADAVVEVFAGIFNGIKAGLRWEWNALVAIVNPILRLLKNVPGLGWLPDRLPEWPGDSRPDASPTQFSSGGVRRMAEGGIVTRATRAIVGEAGPEAVIPLDQLGFGRSQQSVNVTINVQASPLSSPADVGAAVVDALQAWSRRNGRLPTGLVA
jgi:hypothetical protein